jgi:hypothetical protein
MQKRWNGVQIPGPSDDYLASWPLTADSINNVVTCHNQAAADAIFAAAKAAGAVVSESNPIFVYRTDLGCLTACNGRGWADVSGRNLPWQTLPVSSGWAVAGGHTPTICMRGGVVQLAGAVVSNGGDQDNILTIPSQFRPSSEQFIGASVTANGADFESTYAELRVQTDGRLGIKRYTTVRLGNGWIIPISACYIPW